MKILEIKNHKKVLTTSADERITLDVKKNLMTREDVLKILKKRQGGLTQNAFAKEIGVSSQFLTDIFMGRRTPGEKLLSALGLTSKTYYEKAS